MSDLELLCPEMTQKLNYQLIKGLGVKKERACSSCSIMQIHVCLVYFWYKLVYLFAKQSQRGIWSHGYKTFLCSTQLSMKIFLLMNVQMPTIVGILTFMSKKNSILSLSEPQKS